MKTRARRIGGRLLTLALIATVGASVEGQVDPKQARAYFEEAAALCQREGGRLWGVSLCGPMVFADAETGTIAANRQTPDAPRPRALGYANTALEWGGNRWSTFIWKMIPTDDEVARGRLLLHELFHLVQPELELFVAVLPGENDHLDTSVGRYWLQLEWRALARALQASGAERERAVSDALAFRDARRRHFPEAAAREQPSEINEGLAQYTATVAATMSSEAAVENALEQLEQAPEKESFVRTFSYSTGTAYGLLLDIASPGWTRRVKATDDLGELLRTAAELEPSPDAAAVAEGYGGPELWVAEQERDVERQARVAALRARFVDGPVVTLPRGRGASFVTLGLTPIPGAGTIYPSYRVSWEWGRLEAEEVLVSPDGNTLTVPAPFRQEGSTLHGEGWTLTLEPGWSVRAGARSGDFRIVRKEP